MKQKKILLVEDDYLDVISVKRALSKLGVEHELHVAHNGVDALAMLMGSASANNTPGEKVQPDIILLDMNMPKMNGLEFLEIVKKYYSLRDIKVFVMTTSSEEYDKSAAKRLGIAGYILKPLDFGNTSKDETGRAVADLKAELSNVKLDFVSVESNNSGKEQHSIVQKISEIIGEASGRFLYKWNPQLI
jgi:CheY-like chemotaxis protein